uniref:Ninja-family protein n=1 Tax=Oryza glumipatula TaxID=40148 RepID=A0A0D9Z3X3_9ORYZ
MEGFSRDLLCGIGKGGDGPRGEVRPRVDMEAEEVELNLGLSLGGRFGLDRRGEKLARSSSVAAILAAPTEPSAPPSGLFRTSSLPTVAAAEAAKKQGVDELSCRRPSGGAEAEPAAARLPASGSPSSGSSDGEGRRLEVNMTDTLMRTSSLPAGIEDEWRKRKEAQSLKRLEVKRKRIERRNSLTSNISKEAVGQILEEMNAGAEKVESCDDVATGNKKTGGNVNHSSDRNRCTGLPPVHRATYTQQRGSLSGIPTKHIPAMKGSADAEEHNVPSAATEHRNGAAIATPPFSALAVRAVALASRGEQLRATGRVAARAKSMGDVERIMMQEMPCVCTKGLPNGKRVEGFLYKYRKGEEVRIVCVCHGSFLTPAEFVKHAGGGDVANPLRHIVVNPIPPSLY